jgi:hypothetical protein
LAILIAKQNSKGLIIKAGNYKVWANRNKISEKIS